MKYLRRELETQVVRAWAWQDFIRQL